MATARPVLVALVAAVLVLCNAHAQPLTPDQNRQIAQMASRLRVAGPGKTILEYFDCVHGIGYDLVDTGAVPAVKVAVELLAKSDACVTESLLSSLAAALSRNPRTVLPYVDQSPLLSHEEICVPHMIEVPREQALRALRHTEKVLRAVREQALRRNRDVCLAAVGRSIRTVQASVKH